MLSSPNNLKIEYLFPNMEIVCFKLKPVLVSSYNMTKSETYGQKINMQFTLRHDAGYSLDILQ